MPQYVVNRLEEALKLNNGGMQGSSVLVLGLAYKPDVDDVRESPSFELIERLRARGARVDYHDPHVPATHRMRHHDLNMHSVELSPKVLESYDCVLIATDHSACDWQMVADHAKLIVDTRNAMRGLNGRNGDLVRA